MNRRDFLKWVLAAATVPVALKLGVEKELVALESGAVTEVQEDEWSMSHV